MHRETMTVFKTFSVVPKFMKPFLTVMNLVPLLVHFSFSTINTRIYRLTSYAQSQSLVRFPFGTVLYQSLHPSGALSSCFSSLLFHLSGEHTFCSTKRAHFFAQHLTSFLPHTLPLCSINTLSKHTMCWAMCSVLGMYQ